jgi:hypothetical protein
MTDTEHETVEVDEVLPPLDENEVRAMSLFNAQSLQRFEAFGIHTDWKTGIVTLAEDTPDQMFRAYLKGLSNAEERMPVVIGSAINAAQARWGDQYVQILTELTPWKESTILAYAGAVNNVKPEAIEVAAKLPFAHWRKAHEAGFTTAAAQKKAFKHALEHPSARSPWMSANDFANYLAETRKTETPEEERTKREYGALHYSETIEAYDPKKETKDEFKKRSRKKIIDGIEEAQRLYLEPTYAARQAAKKQAEKDKKKEKAIQDRKDRLTKARRALGEQIARIEDADLGGKVQDRLNVAGIALTWPFKKGDVADKDVRPTTALLRKIKAEPKPKEKAAKTAKGKKAAGSKKAASRKASPKKERADKKGIDTSALPFSKPGDK